MNSAEVAVGKLGMFKVFKMYVVLQKGGPPVGGLREKAGAERADARASRTTHTRPFTVSR